MAEPKLLTEDHHRRSARAVRERQWKLMEMAASFGTAWFCVWNKRRKPELADEMRCGLIDGMEILHWINPQHPEWFVLGEWDDERYAMPVGLTDAGRAALAARDQYDDEPVFGGLVEPGWKAFPAPRSDAAA